jgi:hypothetical protein
MRRTVAKSSPTRLLLLLGAKLAKRNQCYVALRCYFSNHSDYRWDFRLHRNCRNVGVDRPCIVCPLPRSLCYLIAIQRKTIRLAVAREGGDAHIEPLGR